MQLRDLIHYTAVNVTTAQRIDILAACKLYPRAVWQITAQLALVELRLQRPREILQVQPRDLLRLRAIRGDEQISRVLQLVCHRSADQMVDRKARFAKPSMRADNIKAAKFIV